VKTTGTSVLARKAELTLDGRIVVLVGERTATDVAAMGRLGQRAYSQLAQRAPRTMICAR